MPDLNPDSDKNQLDSDSGSRNLRWICTSLISTSLFKYNYDKSDYFGLTLSELKVLPKSNN